MWYQIWYGTMLSNEVFVSYNDTRNTLTPWKKLSSDIKVVNNVIKFCITVECPNSFKITFQIKSTACFYNIFQK